MHVTERLYYNDSGILDFTATVVDVRASDRGCGVVLDRTAFYPTGGGQPNDTGKLDTADVTDVFEDESGAIIHLVKDPRSITIGCSVRGLVDPLRRLDHIQQHSGQHILSQAFVQARGAQTRSFHLGTATSTIDIELATPTDDDMRKAEEIANSVIFEDRPMRVHLLDEEGAARLPLRKESAVRGLIRVIEIENFDWSPCGGTHASRTGQVGLIAVKSYERAKKMTRVEFVCGWRALADYRLANNTAVRVARMFSVDRDAAPESVERAVAENKSLKKRVRELLEIALEVEASRLLSAARQSGNFKIVEGAFDGRDLEELRLLASKLVEREPAVALLGTKDAEAARLVFARSATLSHNVGELLSVSCQLLGGRGGGKPDLAQGGGPNREKLEEAIQLAARRVAAS